MPSWRLQDANVARYLPIQSLFFYHFFSHNLCRLVTLAQCREAIYVAKSSLPLLLPFVLLFLPPLSKDELSYLRFATFFTSCTSVRIPQWSFMNNNLPCLESKEALLNFHCRRAAVLCSSSWKSLSVEVFTYVSIKWDILFEGSDVLHKRTRHALTHIYSAIVQENNGLTQFVSFLRFQLRINFFPLFFTDKTFLCLLHNYEFVKKTAFRNKESHWKGTNFVG